MANRVMVADIKRSEIIACSHRDECAYITKAKADGIREFAEKLKGLSYDIEICEEQFDMNRPYFMDVEYKMVKVDDIDKLLAEMEEK